MLLDNVKSLPLAADVSRAASALADLRQALEETPWASLAGTDEFAAFTNAFARPRA